MCYNRPADGNSERILKLNKNVISTDFKKCSSSSLAPSRTKRFEKNISQRMEKITTDQDQTRFLIPMWIDVFNEKSSKKIPCWVVAYKYHNAHSGGEMHLPCANTIDEMLLNF